MSLVRTIIRRLILALALAGMLVGQLAAPCDADDTVGGPDLACMDLCAFTGSGGSSSVQLVSAHSTNTPACDCIHAVAPKTTTCRVANRPASERLQVNTGPMLTVSPPSALCRELVLVADPTPLLFHEILRTTIIQV